MIDRKHAVFTQVNNVVGNTESALRDCVNFNPIATW